MANYGGRRAIFKQCVVEYLGGKCATCGYSKCLAALHPHHKDPSQKRFTIGAAKCRRWALVRKELDKCELLCANCHAELHYKDPILTPRQRKREATIEWPSKMVLSKLVLTQPLVKIAKKLGVSDVAVKKRCKKLGILTRGRGAWSKEVSGHAVQS